jgi:hypothetical protein
LIFLSQQIIHFERSISHKNCLFNSEIGSPFFIQRSE